MAHRLGINRVPSCHSPASSFLQRITIVVVVQKAPSLRAWNGYIHDYSKAREVTPVYHCIQAALAARLKICKIYLDHFVRPSKPWRLYDVSLARTAPLICPTGHLSSLFHLDGQNELSEFYQETLGRSSKLIPEAMAHWSRPWRASFAATETSARPPVLCTSTVTRCSIALAASKKYWGVHSKMRNYDFLCRLRLKIRHLLKE